MPVARTAVCGGRAQRADSRPRQIPSAYEGEPVPRPHRRIELARRESFHILVLVVGAHYDDVVLIAAAGDWKWWIFPCFETRVQVVFRTPHIRRHLFRYRPGAGAGALSVLRAGRTGKRDISCRHALVRSAGHTQLALPGPLAYDSG